MKLFLFPSKSLHHIGLAIAAKKWAVSEGTTSKKARITKANRYFGAGTFGLFYCSADRTFRVPFQVLSHADHKAVVTDIWPGKWHLPFDIEPLAPLHRRVPKKLADHLWGSLLDNYYSGNCVFTPIVGFDNKVWQSILGPFVDLSATRLEGAFRPHDGLNG